jgi:mono/diheme cytochrome c family protein
LAGILGYFISEGRINQTYDVAAQPLDIPTDAASVEEGRRLVAIRGCADCHGVDLGGAVMLDDPMVGRVYAANLTTGAGSATAGFTAADWEHAIRHGIGPDGRGLIIMPATDYAGLSDEDLGRMVAYLRTIPPVDRPIPEPVVGPMGRFALLTNQLPVLPAELVDHTVRPPHSVTPEVSVAYGAYMIAPCMGCHGPNLAGGPVPASAPGDPPAANLTPSGDLAGWTLEEFKNTLHTGVTPEDKVLNPAYMPWPATLEMTDTELEAIWAYLQSLPPVTTVN